MARYYTITDSQGAVHVLTLHEMSQKIQGDEAIKKRFEEILLNSANKRRKKDGFEPGFQPNTNRYAGGRLEYEKQLKEMGLVEIGYDYVPQASEGGVNPCHSEEFVKACIETGVELSGQEAEAIKSGGYFKDVHVVD